MVTQLDAGGPKKYWKEQVNADFFHYIIKNKVSFLCREHLQPIFNHQAPIASMEESAPPPPPSPDTCTYNNVNDMIVWENAALRKALEHERCENEAIREENTLLRNLAQDRASKLLDMQQQFFDFRNMYAERMAQLEDSVLRTWSIFKLPITVKPTSNI